MTIRDCGMSILQEISSKFTRLDEQALEALVDKIKNAKKVFFVGAGRSRFMLEGFCMRLNHLGISAFMAGNIPCPPAEKGDLVIAASGSGETPSVVAILKRLKGLGIDIFLFTANPSDKMRDIADTVLHIDAACTLSGDGDSSRQLMRTPFEQVVFLIGEAVVEKMSESMSVESIVNRHTNLE